MIANMYLEKHLLLELDDVVLTVNQDPSPQQSQIPHINATILYHTPTTNNVKVCERRSVHLYCNSGVWFSKIFRSNVNRNKTSIGFFPKSVIVERLHCKSMGLMASTDAFRYRDWRYCCCWRDDLVKVRSGDKYSSSSKEPAEVRSPAVFLLWYFLLLDELVCFFLERPCVAAKCCSINCALEESVSCGFRTVIRSPDLALIRPLLPPEGDLVRESGRREESDPMWLFSFSLRAWGLRENKLESVDFFATGDFLAASNFDKLEERNKLLGPDTAVVMSRSSFFSSMGFCLIALLVITDDSLFPLFLWYPKRLRPEVVGFWTKLLDRSRRRPPPPCFRGWSSAAFSFMVEAGWLILVWQKGIVCCSNATIICCFTSTDRENPNFQKSREGGLLSLSACYLMFLFASRECKECERGATNKRLNLRE